MTIKTRSESLSPREHAAAVVLATLAFTATLITMYMGTTGGPWWCWLLALSGLILGADMIRIVMRKPAQRTPTVRQQPDSDMSSEPE